MQTIPHVNTHLKLLDEIITKENLPALMGCPVSDDSLRDPILEECSSSHYESWKSTTAPLVAIMVNQEYVLAEKTLVGESKSKIIKRNELALQKSKNNKKISRISEMGYYQSKGESRIYLAFHTATRRIWFQS